MHTKHSLQNIFKSNSWAYLQDAAAIPNSILSSTDFFLKSSQVKITWKGQSQPTWKYSKKISRKFTASEWTCWWLWTKTLLPAAALSLSCPASCVLYPDATECSGNVPVGVNRSDSRPIFPHIFQNSCLFKWTGWFCGSLIVHRKQLCASVKQPNLIVCPNIVVRKSGKQTITKWGIHIASSNKKKYC